MPEITINGVKFTNVPNKRTGVKLGNKISQTNFTGDLEEYLASEDFYKLISAIDIDWNGIEIGENVIINDTADLINWIFTIASKAGANGKSAYDLYKESVNESNAIYSFTSWNLDGTKQYGEGTVEVIEQRLGGATVKVLTNTDFGSNPTDFVGMEFDVQQPLSSDDLIQLYIGDEPQQIAVRATLQTSAVVAMTQQEWLASLKGEQGEQGPQGKTGTFDSSKLEDYATKEYVSQEIEKVVGAAPENFDTLKEFADAMGDLKVVDTEAVPAVEGEHYTQEEINEAQEGDDAYGKTVEDWKVEPVEGVEEQSHNMTIKEFVENSMEAVNEKPQIEVLQSKYNALLTLLNLRDTDVNNIIVNQKLANSNNVTFSDGTVDNITVPETTKSTTVTAELDTNSNLTLTSAKGVTINNTGAESTNLTVNAPAEGTSTPTVTLKSGTYDTVTVQDASLTVSNDATVQNVIITEETTKSTTINAMFVEGATITSNSEAPITVNNKNAEGQEVSVTLNAPGSTVTLSGGKWTTISGEVSENTLIIKGNAKIVNLNLTKGNVIVEVPRSEDIATVISGEINLGEGYSITHRTYEITNENSSKLGGIGEMILQEDITRTSSIVAPLAPAYNAVWNLNGHNITVTGTPKSGIYLNRYTSNLEVKGTGVIRAEGSYGLWNSATGKIIVNDGVTIEAQTHAIYAEKGIIEINGGVFKLTNASTEGKDQNGNLKFLLNCYDANHKAGTANIIVRGGTFYGFNPAESYGEPNSPVSFVAEGYESILDHVDDETGLNVYIVRKITSEESTENQTVNGEVTSENGTDTQIYNG